MTEIIRGRLMHSPRWWATTPGTVSTWPRNPPFVRIAGLASRFSPVPQDVDTTELVGPLGSTGVAASLACERQPRGGGR